MSPDAAAIIVPHLPWIIGGALALGAAGVAGWIHTTRLRIKHGYPLEGMWGQSLKPGMGEQAQQRITLLTQENAELRAEVGSVKDRLANVERIVTDSGYQIGSEIDALRDRALENLPEKRKRLMWGADTPLVMDALLIAGLAAAGGVGLLALGRRLLRNSKPDQRSPSSQTNLEERIQVLERIATNRSHELAAEIEQLRDTARNSAMKKETQS